MTRLKIGDIVKDEYGLIGKIKEINYPHEIMIEVLGTFENDKVYSDIRKASLTTDKEIAKIFEV